MTWSINIFSGEGGPVAEDYYSTRHASVKHRPTASRRISAAELETLMVRQGQSGQYQPMHYDQVRGEGNWRLIPPDSFFDCKSDSYVFHSSLQESLCGDRQTPKKFSSVADMKRRKQQRAPGESPQPGLHRINPEPVYQVRSLLICTPLPFWAFLNISSLLLVKCMEWMSLFCITFIVEFSGSQIQ